MKTIILTLAFGIIWLSATESNAQQIMLQKATISSGSGSVSNATMRGQITVGQPVVGRASNGQTLGQFGFWTSANVAAGVAPTLGTADGIALNVYPNPTSEKATAKITLANTGDVDLRVYDETGKEMMVLLNGSEPKGDLSVKVDLSKLATGTYILALRTPGTITERAIKVIR